WERNVDARGVEGGLQAPAVLAPHGPLLDRRSLESRPDVDGVFAERFHAEHFERLEDLRGECRVALQIAGYALHDANDVVDVLLVRDTHVEHHRRPRLGHVGESFDLPILEDVHHTRQIAEHDRAQADGFDDATCAVDYCDITFAHVILEQLEEARYHVSYQFLSAEADRNPE